MSEMRLGPRRPPVALDTPTGVGWLHTLWRLAVLLAVLTGAGMRVWSVLGPRSWLNSDESIEGLMALRLLHHGTLPAFYWGQSYGGTADAVVVAGLMRVFGETSAATISVQYAEGALAAVLVWRIGLRVLDPGRAALAGALVWVWPAAFVLLQSRPNLFYQLTLCAGLVVVLMALRVAERPADGLSWAALGLAAGLDFWTSPQSLYYLLPVCLWLPGRLGLRQLCKGWPAPLLAVVGAAPWLVVNSAHGWPSLQQRDVVPYSLGDRLVTFIQAGLPAALGLRIPDDSSSWLGPGAQVGYVLALVALLAAFIPAVRRSSLHLLVLLSFPVVYGIVPVFATLGNGRYFIFLGAPLALALSSLARGVLARVALLAVCTVLALLGLARSVVPQIPPTTALQRMLATHSMRYAYAGYWTSYKLTWESRERVIATPMVNVRYPPYDEKVDAATRVAVIYSDRGHEQPQAAAMRGWLTSSGTRFSEASVDGYDTFFLPDRDLSRSEIPPAARVAP